MTTIAYKNNIIAADTQTTYNGSYTIHNALGKKLYVVEGGVLVYTGTVDDSILYDYDYEKTNSVEDLIDYANHLTKRDYNGEVIYFQKLDPLTIHMAIIEAEGDNNRFWLNTLDLEPDAGFATGSGHAFALGAMEAGMSAQEAVIVASKFDLGTNDILDIWEL